MLLIPIVNASVTLTQVALLELVLYPISRASQLKIADHNYLADYFVSCQRPLIPSGITIENLLNNLGKNSVKYSTCFHCQRPNDDSAYFMRSTIGKAMFPS